MSEWDTMIRLSVQEKTDLCKKLEPCPNCGHRSIGLEDDGFPANWHGYCWSCSMIGPKSETPVKAVEAWNKLPRRPGPQTTAVLAELADKLQNQSYSQFNSYMQGFDVCLTIADREAFLKEQGMAP